MAVTLACRLKPQNTVAYIFHSTVEYTSYKRSVCVVLYVRYSMFACLLAITTSNICPMWQISGDVLCGEPLLKCPYLLPRAPKHTHTHMHTPKTKTYICKHALQLAFIQVCTYVCIIHVVLCICVCMRSEITRN